MRCPADCERAQEPGSPALSWPFTAFQLWVCLLMCWGATPAHAQTSLSGEWHAEPMTVRWVIGEWGAACGPRPSAGGDAGGSVTIEARGNELRISGAGRAYSTEQCWEMHPGLAAQSHSGGQRAWKTTCRTPANDARQEILQTSISATDDSITFQESGQYQFAVQGQTCTASSGRWRTYRRLPVGAEPNPIPAEEPAPAQAAAPGPCASPGAPSRIEARPARKLMRAGESFQFRATVLDRRGCALRIPVSWEISPSDGPARLTQGLLSIPEGAADAQLSVVASAATQSVRIGVEVVSDERYAGLLASGEFNAEGASGDAVAATITSGSLGAQPPPTRPEPAARKWTFVGVVSAIAIIFAALGTWLARRASGAARRGAPRDTGTLVYPGDPVARTRSLVGVGGVTRLEPRGSQAPALTQLEPDGPRVAKATTVCPICGTLYENQLSKVCPKDGAQLLPVNA
jgi:hypothetical protein